jgi:hypothetical protein
MPVNTAAVTVRLALGEVTPLNAAVIVLPPCVTPVAMPLTLLIVATAVLPDAQVTWLVMVAVLASV